MNDGTQVEHAEAASHAVHHEPSVGDLFWPALNFALFLAVATKYLTGPIQEFFRARTQSIREGLAAGARAKQEADALRAQIAKDLADLPKLRAQMTEDLRATAEQQRDRGLEQAKAAAVRIRNDAQVQAEHEVTAARLSLRQDVIAKAVHEATQLVRGAATADDHVRLVREFADAARSAP